MRIIVLGTRGFPNVQGGVEKHCQELYPRLVKLGCEIVVLARAPYVGDKEYNWQGVQVVPIKCSKNKFLEAVLHTYKGLRRARKFKPDIVHIHAIGPSLFVPMAHKLGAKIVMTHHGPDYKRAKWNWFARAVLRIGEARGCKYADAVICISEQIVKEVREKFNRYLFVIPNGVTLPEIVKTDETLKRFGLEKKQYLLAVGRFVPEKGFHDLIEAFLKVKPAGWKLVIVGAADHEDSYSIQLKKMAQDNSQVVLTGFLSGQPLEELYSHAGLFVLPSYYEGLPIVLLEALSYGLSCLVSDIPANREVGLAQERYFPVGDKDALAQKIKEFIAQPMSQQQQFVQRSEIAQKYDWDKIAVQTLEVYKSVC
ncbi:MAG: glycosyltransferase family 4 protein [Candidatus Omnitrophica bacterium]|nr:glycosyltransferase family 4 protein [Candidatus Omnitrophota bacterium]